MKKLESQQFSKARDFLLLNARPLDRAMFRFEFEQGSADKVLEELAAFRNNDGGFGHALEPDFRLPSSSALATTIGLQYISRMHRKESPSMAVEALHYLRSIFDSEHQLWESVPESVSEYPRAVWWEYPGPEKAEEHWANPGSEILGYLYEFPMESWNGWRESLLSKAFDKLDSCPGPLEMHDLLCYLRLAERLPKSLQMELYSKLDSHVQQVVATSVEQWRNYGLQPIHVAPSPESHYYEALQPYVSENLEFLIEEQGDDGAWNPAWQWWRYEQEWEQAKREWKGALTRDSLQILRAYGRLNA